MGIREDLVAAPNQRERHRLKAEAFANVASLAGQSWTFGEYVATIVSGPRLNVAMRVVELTARITRNGVDVTPANMNPLQYLNPPIAVAPGGAIDLSARLLDIVTDTLRGVVAGLVGAPLPPPLPSGAFLSRPTSAALRIVDATDVLIDDRTFRDFGANVIAISLERVRRAVIRACDFANVAEGVYALDCEDIIVEDCRYQNIIGPHARVGINRANFAQFNRVNGGAIRRNKGKGGDTEDIISLHQCNGTAAVPLAVEDNHFDGTGWISASGSGIALGDGGGSYQVARRNTLLNPGAVGIFIAGGINHKILDNAILGERLTGSNVAIYVWGQSGECSGHEVSRNRARWTRADGLDNPFWNGGNCGPILNDDNIWPDATLDAAQMQVAL